MVKTEDIIKQLVDAYYKNEYWHKTRMPYTEAVRYHNKLFTQGNIVIYEELGIILGYYEVWRINFEQFGRIICREHFSSFWEDVDSGNVAYVANAWIDKDFRKGRVANYLIKQFFKQNHHCTHYCGSALRKKTQPIKVFKKSELSSKLFKGGF